MPTNLARSLAVLSTFAVGASAACAQAAESAGAKPAPAFSRDHLIELAVKYGPEVFKALGLLIIGWLIAGWIGKLVANTCRKARLDETLARFLGNFARWAVLAAVVIMCLSSFGVQVTSLVAILGSIGVAVGLALQGSLSHIASGIMLLIFRPFKIGDSVVAGGQTGVVNEIGLFSTTLDTPDNRRIIVPNGAIVSGVITNATHHGERLISVQVPTDGSVPLDKARATMQAAAESVGGRIAGKPVRVALTKMEGANTWTVSAWVKTSEMDAAHEALLIACNKAAKEAGILPAAPVTLVKNV